MTISTYDQLQQLAEDFWTWRAANQPISSDDIPRIERPDGWTPDWSRKAFERRRAELDCTLAIKCEDAQLTQQRRRQSEQLIQEAIQRQKVLDRLDARLVELP